MRVSQLLHTMDKRADIVIHEGNAPDITSMRIFDGEVKDIKRDNPINRMHIHHIYACDDTLYVLAEMPREEKNGREGSRDDKI